MLTAKRSNRAWIKQMHCIYFRQWRIDSITPLTVSSERFHVEG